MTPKIELPNNSTNEDGKSAGSERTPVLFSSFRPDELHPDSAQLIIDFANALAEKMAASEKKYGWKNEWFLQDWEEECRVHMMRHLQKGDPKDVAIYAAFMWKRGWSTAPLTSTKEVGGVCRFVKASKRLPEKDGLYNATFNDEPCVMRVSNGVVDRLQFATGGIYSVPDKNKLKCTEWLEEITQPSPTVKEGEPKVADLTLSQLVDKSLQMGKVPLFTFEDLGAEQQQDSGCSGDAPVKIGNAIEQGFSKAKYQFLISRDKPFFIDTFRNLLNQYDKEQITLSKVVEELNVQAYKWYLGKHGLTLESADKILSITDDDIDAKVKMLNSVQSVQASVATEDATGNPKLATKFYTQEEVESLLKDAVGKIDEARVGSLKEGNDSVEKKLYDAQMIIFQAMDILNAPSPLNS